MPTTRCSKREAGSRLLRPQRWMPQGLRSDAKGEPVFADADRCPFYDAGLHGLLPFRQRTHACALGLTTMVWRALKEGRRL